MKEITYREAYNRYSEEMKNATELTINPDNGHAYFSACEAAITPIIKDFITVQGSETQVVRYYNDTFEITVNVDKKI